LQNSKEIQVAKIQASERIAPRRSPRRSSCPICTQAPGRGTPTAYRNTGRAGTIDLQRVDTEQVFNEPLRGQAKETQEQAKAQRILLEDAKNSVITRTAMAYLELGKVRHSLDLLRKEQESAEKILQVTQERQGKDTNCRWK